MGVILDSCIWVGLATGEISRDRVIATTGNAPIHVSAISLGELAFGVEACADASERAARAACLRQLDSQPVLAVGRQTAAAFGILAASVKQSGRSPRPRYNDLWIAAQAIEHGHALLTLNRDDFAGLPGLDLIHLAG